MTQSGQGEEPSPRVAREGIVLPSDGGEPLLPGMTGRSGGQPAPAPAPPPAPTGGQAWGQSWGPDTNQPRTHPQAQPPAAEGWSTPDDAQQHQQWGAQGQFQPQPQYQPEQQAPSAQAPAWNNDPRGADSWPQQPGYGAQQAPGAPLPVPHAESAPPPPVAGGTPMPQHQQQPYGQPQHPGAYGQYGAPSAPLPPEGGAAVPYAAAPGAPLPHADEGATQYIPPVAGAS
ncbi:hypothetical protein RB628_00140, partial [Streptomyces sp. ADMS]|nr:hypothetical protein [Streptomyces sp. ADMS]